jgi:hypothetical protein
MTVLGGWGKSVDACNDVNLCLAQRFTDDRKAQALIPEATNIHLYCNYHVRMLLSHTGSFQALLKDKSDLCLLYSENTSTICPILLSSTHDVRFLLLQEPDIGSLGF